MSKSKNPNKMRSKLLTCGLACFWSLAMGCSSNDGPNYGGPGAIPMGGACYTVYDCATGYCCTSPPCRGGMCTYACRSDFDCPLGFGCDGGACFWNCRVDSECALGQTCKKAHSLCQY
jgi:hypothetical protein